MRRIVLDTETTGLEVSQGHRIVEIAGVELFDRRPTGNNFHRYLNPDRDVDPAAKDVHGLDAEFLADKPRFGDIARELVEYLEGAELLIHNAPFDVGFLDAELALAGLPGIETLCTVTDTLAMARKLRRGQKNSLDALCKHYEVDNSRRSLHGALLDAQLLADVWLAMTRGQDSLDISLLHGGDGGVGEGEPARHGPLAVIRASAEERAAHAAMCGRIDKESKGRCLWKQLEGA